MPDSGEQDREAQGSQHYERGPFGQDIYDRLLRFPDPMGRLRRLRRRWRRMKTAERWQTGIAILILLVTGAYCWFSYRQWTAMNKSLDISWETLIAEHGAQLGIANTQTLQLPALEPGKDFQAVFRLSNGGGGTADPVFAGCNPSILFPTNPPPSWTFDEMEFANVDFGQRGRLVPNEHLDFECTVAGQLLTEERVAAIKKRDAILYLQIVVAFSDQFRNWAGFTQCARYDITTSTPRLYACSMHGPAENPQGTPRP